MKKQQVLSFIKNFFWSFVLGAFCILGFGTPLIQTLAINTENPNEIDYYIADSLIVILFVFVVFVLYFTMKSKVKFTAALISLSLIILMLIWYFHIGMFV